MLLCDVETALGFVFIAFHQVADARKRRGVPIPGKFLGLGSHTAMEPDSVELAQFREQWKAEVQNKRKAVADAAAQPGPSEPSRVHAAVLLATQKHPDPKRISPDAAAVYGNTVSSQKLHSALQFYRDAIHREQNGDLDDALVLYRKAFRLVFSITYDRLSDNLNYFRCRIQMWTVPTRGKKR